MCCNVCEIISNSPFFSFVLMTYSALLFADITRSEIMLSPAKTNESQETSLLGVKSENRTLRKNISKWDSTAADHHTARFGPRSDRKKRSLSFDEEITEILDDRIKQKNKKDQSVLRYRNGYTLALLPILEEGYVSKRQLLKSKLSRDNSWSDDEDNIIKAPPFSPRLGRRSLIPLKPRLGRAGNSPETAVFKPRLGRDPSMHEFNEYVADVRVEDKDH